MLSRFTSKTMINVYLGSALVFVANAALGNPLAKIGERVRGFLPFAA